MSEPFDPFYALPGDDDNRPLPERDIMQDKQGFRDAEEHLKNPVTFPEVLPNLFVGAVDSGVDPEERRLYVIDFVKQTFKTDDANALIATLATVEAWLRTGQVPDTLSGVAGGPSAASDPLPGGTEPDDPTGPEKGTQTP